jgi:hypothetical protein
MTKIWIDTASGTWGELESSQGSLVIVDLESQAKIDRDSGFDSDHDSTSLLAALEDMSDDEIVDYGLRHGKVAQ